MLEFSFSKLVLITGRKRCGGECVGGPVVSIRCSEQSEVQTLYNSMVLLSPGIS